MKNQRGFSLEFKRQVVEELLSGESRPAQLYRRHNISSSVIYRWKKQYSRGKFNNEPTQEAALKDRVEKLERLVGKLTLENEFFKKGVAEQPQPSRQRKKLVTWYNHLFRNIHRGCELIKLPRSSFYYKSKSRSPESREGKRFIGQYRSHLPGVSPLWLPQGYPSTKAGRVGSKT